MTFEESVRWRAYVEALLYRAPVDARVLGASYGNVRRPDDPPANVAYCVIKRGADAIVGFDVKHRAVWSRGVLRTR